MSSNQEEYDQLEDPYAILNVPINADQKQIKEKYYEYSRVFHPDKQQPHLYLESRSQFEQIDKAYKAISNPFSKLIYDNYGYPGVIICNEHSNKFIDLEEQYVQTYEQRLNHKHEYKLRLQELKKEVLQRMNHLYDLYREERSYINCYRNIQINSDFNAVQLIQDVHHINPTQSKQLILTRLSFIPILYLPEIKKYQIQQELGLSASAAGIFGQQQDFNGGFFYKISKKLPQEMKYLGGSDIRGSFYHSYKSTEGSLELATNPYKDLNITYSARVGQFGFLPIITFNRSLSNTFSVNSQISAHGGQINDLNYGFVKIFTNPRIRVDFDGNINENEANTEVLLSRDITKKFSILGGLVQKGEKKPQYWKLKLYACIGWKMAFNSHNFLEVRSCFGMGNNEVQIRFKRNGLICSLPISLGPFPSTKAVSYSILSCLLSGYCIYSYQLSKKNSKKNQMVLIKKNKNRLVDEKKIFSSYYSDLLIKNEDKLNLEISNDGLVILKAYGGQKRKIQNIYKIFQSKENKLPYLVNEDIVKNAINRQIDVGLDLEDILCEVVEITPYIQNLVNHSYIDLTYTEIAKEQGLFNPCIEVTTPTAIYIQYSYKGVVNDIIISSGSRLRIGNINNSSIFHKFIAHYILNSI
ncbi:hypothetical protein ABPG72_002661 [Tetrahymena utriculariae]